MAKQVAKFSKAALPPPPAAQDFINGVSRANAAKQKLPPLHDVKTGAPINVFNNTNAVETERFQHSLAAAQTCWLGFPAMRRVTPETFCSSRARIVATQKVGPKVGIAPHELGRVGEENSKMDTQPWSMYGVLHDE